MPSKLSGVPHLHISAHVNKQLTLLYKHGDEDQAVLSFARQRSMLADIGQPLQRISIRSWVKEVWPKDVVTENKVIFKNKCDQKPFLYMIGCRIDIIQETFMKKNVIVKSSQPRNGAKQNA